MTLIRSLALTGLMAFALSGCTGGDMRTESIEQGYVGTEEFGPAVMDEMVISEPADMGALDDVSRSVIVTGDVYLTVDDPLATADQVETLVIDAGGRVDSRSESAGIEGDNPSAYLWVRIPVDQLESTLDDIEAFGVVETQSINNQDVTLQVVDLDARIAVLEESIQRLRDLLAEATTTAELVEVETALSERQAELDSLTSQRTYLTDQVQFASIGIDLRTPEVAPEREADGFFEGIIAGWNGMIAFFAGTIVFLGVLVPWLGLLGAIAALVAVAVWLRRRGR